MKIALNKSSLLAAIEISKDKGILDYKNLNHLESIKNCLNKAMEPINEVG